MFSQILFEKGYFIDNKGNKIECLIKNVDWVDNPDQFEYKINIESKSKIAKIENVQEFEIYNFSKFKRFFIELDLTNYNSNKLNEKRKTILKKDTVFLKYLIDGKVSLFLYSMANGTLNRFFISKNYQDPQPLIYNRFVDNNLKIHEDKQYLQFLWNNFRCGNITKEKIERIKYNDKDLTNFITDYIKCKDFSFVNYRKKPKREIFHSGIRAGINYSWLVIDVQDNKLNDFEKKLGVGLGLDFEFVLPFNKNKWTIFLQPYYQNYKSEVINQRIFIYDTIYSHDKVVYNSIEIPLGLRYYMFLNKRDRIFVEAAYSYNIAFDSFIDFEKRNDLDINPNPNLSIGAGIKKYNFTVLFKYSFNRNVLSDYPFWYSNYNYLSFNVGYDFL